MSDLKTGLMYSELSNKVYWGTLNKKTGIARSGKKDVTSDFIGVMLQKFPVGFRQNIECNGVVEAVVIVVNEEKSHRYSCVNDMYDEIERDMRWLERMIGTHDESHAMTPVFKEMLHNKVCLLAKARGEHD